METIGPAHHENTAPIYGFSASNDSRRSRLPFTGPEASHSTTIELCGDGESSAAAAAVFCLQKAVIDDATN
ncbi:hypothetical protein [Rhizobium lentis]|uniref:hypothetical protein n=1 Tax=Rhizobium lentis TaxID=1138194 RepID=UPI001C839739|nr:hypothetical protein [Rhizobium lentis]MBX5050824.1 hypothetical protein [Rhizobium lentis]MBX5062838.1 hypothetical protein [Rhizobium lentis]